MKERYFGIYFNNNIPKLNKKKKYNKDIKFVFEGIAYLINNRQNNEDKLEIKSGYILKEPGNYQLEYINTSKKFYTINFILKKRTCLFFIIYILFLFFFILLMFTGPVYKNSINKNIIYYIKDKKGDDNYQNKYVFKISYYNTEFKEVNFLDTINNGGNMNRKIAPGVFGKFEIILDTKGSDTDMEYKIQFLNQTIKPKNLLFSLEKSGKYDSLKELERQLFGIVKKNTTKSISIYWKWNYSNEMSEDLQDTRDGEELNAYKFKILVTGGERIERR